MKRINSKQTGYSIVEVMISVLVLAIGFLGMAGLQATSLQNSQRSVLRTQAAYLSYEILDKMRSNNSAPAYNAYKGASGALGAVTNCLAQECSDAQLANFDVAEWRCSLGQEAACSALPDGAFAGLDNALPGGTGVIEDGVNGAVKITIQWDESRNQNADIQDFVLETKL